MVMVPRNSTAGGFAYIRQSKWVMIAIKTEERKFTLSAVIVAVASLDLNPIQTGLFWSICDWGGGSSDPPSVSLEPTMLGS